ncbi:hypothetical protein HMPREF1275_00192 [Propionibacterium sp. KPL1844]|nr:hypothetical protein HMPREF1275_00192 [Propionibacterium sp. KPL1844]
MQTRACGVVTHTTTDEPNPDPHLRQANLGNVTTLIDSRLRDEDPRAKAVEVVPVVLTRTTTDELDPTPPHLRQAAPRDIMTLMGHSPVTETLAPATRTRPAEIDRFREQTRLSRHARFVGATDNGRRERPDGPIWISVSICGQTPQS